MMDQALQVEKALRGMFPGAQVTIRELDYGHALLGSVTIDNKRYGFRTPQTVSAKNEAPEYWIHRFTLLLREHYKL